MIVDTAIFGESMGFNETSVNALKDLSLSFNLARTDFERDDIAELDELVRYTTKMRNNKISVPEEIGKYLNHVEKVMFIYDPEKFSISYGYAAFSRKVTGAIYGNVYTGGDRADAFRHSYGMLYQLRL